MKQNAYLPQFNKPDVNRGDLSSRVENMYEILKDISSELHNIRVSRAHGFQCPNNILTANVFSTEPDTESAKPRGGRTDRRQSATDKPPAVERHRQVVNLACGQGVERRCS